MTPKTELVVKTTSAQKLPEILEKGHCVIDVRSPKEFESEHVSGAELMPLDSFDAEEFCRSHGTEAPVYILCQSGARASKAAEKLAAAGHGAVSVVEGGTNAAKEAGINIERGKQTLSLERQVRIAAGSLVFIFSLLAAFVHGGFLAVPAFIGAGLVFAGITNTCGMGMMLSKCPWNQ